MIRRQLALHKHTETDQRERFPIVGTVRHHEVAIGDDVQPHPLSRDIAGTHLADVGSETMSPEVIMQFRATIASGAYDAPAAIAALADALIASQDL